MSVPIISTDHGQSRSWPPIMASPDRGPDHGPRCRPELGRASPASWNCCVCRSPSPTMRKRCRVDGRGGSGQANRYRHRSAPSMMPVRIARTNQMRTCADNESYRSDGHGQRTVLLRRYSSSIHSPQQFSGCQFSTKITWLGIISMIFVLIALLLQGKPLGNKPNEEPVPQPAM